MSYETIHAIAAQLTEKSAIYFIIAFTMHLCQEIGGKNASKQAYLKKSDFTFG